MVDEPIVDGEIVTSEDATVVLSLEQLIKSHIVSIDKLREELKKNKQMLSDALLSDAVFQENDRQAKEAAKVKNTTKLQILKQPQNMAISNKIKSFSTELKDKQFSLSDYLLEYQRMTGVNQIEDEDGQVREIVQTAKLIKKAQ